MTNESSPRPWRVELMFNGVADARGEKVAANIRASDAALIVDAVNERDRLRDELADKARNYEDVIACHQRTEESLRDIVRRLLPLAETTVENIRALGTARFPFLEQIKSDRLRGDINREVSNADHLLREARDAIGEDKE